MQGIVCISGTNRPENYTSRALGVVVDALRQSGNAPVVFDARTLSLAFPGQPDPGDGERLRTAIAAAPGVILATPEYHGSFCAMTKLIIENLGFPSVLAGKPVALVGVAAGRIGGHQVPGTLEECLWAHRRHRSPRCGVRGGGAAGL